jgi:hypothetical protein
MDKSGTGIPVSKVVLDKMLIGLGMKAPLGMNITGPVFSESHLGSFQVTTLLPLYILSTVRFQGIRHLNIQAFRRLGCTTTLSEASVKLAFPRI